MLRVVHGRVGNVALPEEMCIRDRFMIGHSMGGFGAASYGTAHPGKLDGYVLSGAWTRDHAGLASGAVEQGLDPETVSYTHLDVYKRQRWLSAWRQAK